MIPDKATHCKNYLSSAVVLVRKSAKEERRTRMQGCTAIQIKFLNRLLQKFGRFYKIKLQPCG